MVGFEDFEEYEVGLVGVLYVVFEVFFYIVDVVCVEIGCLCFWFCVEYCYLCFVL